MVETKLQPADAEMLLPAKQKLLGNEKLRLDILKDAVEATKDPVKKAGYLKQVDEKEKSIETLENEIRDSEKQEKDKAASLEFKSLAAELQKPPAAPVTTKPPAVVPRVAPPAAQKTIQVRVPTAKPPTAAPAPERIPAIRPLVAPSLTRKPSVTLKEEARIDGKTAKEWCEEGRTSLYAGKCPEAIGNLDKALSLDAKLVDAWYYKSCAHDEMGNAGEALKSRNKGLQIDPNHKLLLSLPDSLPGPAPQAVPKAEEPKPTPPKVLAQPPSPVVAPKEKAAPAPTAEEANSLYNKTGGKIGGLNKLLIDADSNTSAYKELESRRNDQIVEFSKINPMGFSAMGGDGLRAVADALLEIRVKIEEMTDAAGKLPKRQAEQIIAPKLEQTPPPQVAPKTDDVPPEPSKLKSEASQLQKTAALPPASYSVEDAIAEYSRSINKGKRLLKKKISEESKKEAHLLAGIADRLQATRTRKGTADSVSFTSRFNQASADAKAVTMLYLGNFPELKAEIGKANVPMPTISVDHIKGSFERRKAELDALRGIVDEAQLTEHKHGLDKIGKMDLGGMADTERRAVFDKLIDIRDALMALRRGAGGA